MPWYPPCNNSYGYMGRDGYSVRCEGAPDHKGAHFNRDAGIRWNGYGRSVPRCMWRACTAPDRQTTDDGDTVHLCPGGEAERQFTRPAPDAALAAGGTDGR